MIMKYYGPSHLKLLLIIALFSFIASAQENDTSIKTSYDEETGKTTISLPLVKLPRNKRSFAVGAFFQFAGTNPEKRPCCVTIVFASIGKKQFEYEDNHRISFLADKEKLDFSDAFWKESDHATAFVIAGIAYPEEVYLGMASEKFLKIAHSKTIKAQIGSFKFEFTEAQRRGFVELAAKLDQSVKAPNLNSQ